MRQVFRSTLQSVAPIAGGALTAEILLRLFLDPAVIFTEHHRLFCEFDPQLGWRKKPNYGGIHVTPEYQVYERFNSRGLRGREYTYEKPAGEYRLLFLGDSFAEGYSVHFHDLFSRRLEIALNTEQSAKRYCCINAGTGGYSTDQELLFFMSEGSKYCPDLTVLMFYENDLLDNTTARSIRQAEKPLFQLSGEDMTVVNLPLSEPALPTTPSKQKLWTRMARTSYLLGLSVYSTRQVAFVASLFRRKLSTLRRQYSIPKGFWIWAEDEPAEVQEAWQLTERLLAALRDRVAESGGQLLVFYVPSQAGVYPELWRTLRNLYGIPAAGWSVDRVAKRLAECCARQQIELLDPSAEFRAQAARLAPLGKLLYYQIDGHWNREGHRLAAGVLERYIKGSTGRISRLIPSPCTY